MYSRHVVHCKLQPALYFASVYRISGLNFGCGPVGCRSNELPLWTSGLGQPALLNDQRGTREGKSKSKSKLYHNPKDQTEGHTPKGSELQQRLTRGADHEG
jgi:hypothetical protein